MKRNILLACVLALPIAGLGLIGPPSGRPPTNALRRYEPKKYEVRFEVVLTMVPPTANAADVLHFSITDAPIIMPVIYQGAYSRVFPNSEDGRIMLDGPAIPNPHRSIDEGKPFHTHHLRMVIPKFNGQSIRWTVLYTTQTWSADIDERLAQQTTWPRDIKWPDEIADALKPQMYIESNNEVFTNIIAQKLGGDQLRTVSPYIAAKRIVAFVLSNFQVIGSSVNRRSGGTLQGIHMQGALKSLQRAGPDGKARGSEHDLVCLCVALLRAAKIPARAVIGASDASNKTEVMSWAEFYLPGSGWVSFDPHAMKDNGPGQYRSFNTPWKDFGEMEDLNERVVLSYHFHPPASGIEVPGYGPALWGWDPRKRQPSYEQSISIKITNKGKGVEDPR